VLYTFVFNETSPAAPGTVASSGPVQNAASYLPPGVAGPFDDVDSVDVFAELVGATGGNLIVYVQVSPDEGINYYDAIAFPTLNAGAGAAIYRATLSYAQQSQTTAIATLVGKNLNPALTTGGANGIVVPGEGFNRVRLVFTAGSGTTKGATVRVVLCGKRSSGRISGQ